MTPGCQGPTCETCGDPPGLSKHTLRPSVPWSHWARLAKYRDLNMDLIQAVAAWLTKNKVSVGQQIARWHTLHRRSGQWSHRRRQGWRGSHPHSQALPDWCKPRTRWAWRGCRYEGSGVRGDADMWHDLQGTQHLLSQTTQWVTRVENIASALVLLRKEPFARL